MYIIIFETSNNIHWLCPFMYNYTCIISDIKVNVGLRISKFKEIKKSDDHASI
jgi:hypothetical protein